MNDDAQNQDKANPTDNDLPLELADGTLQFQGDSQMKNYMSRLVKREFVKAKYDLSEEDVQSLIRPLSDKVAPVPPIEGYLQYLNIYTDPEVRGIWVDGQRGEMERFNTDSSLFYLWLLLLERRGKPMEKTDITEHVREKTRRTGEPITSFNLEKTLENLKRKLRKITGASSKEIAKWFSNTDTHLSLKNLG